MSSLAIFKTTLQSALLNGSSNVIAQGITSYRHGTRFTLDYIESIRFMICTLITTPFMVLWQNHLEIAYPASPDHNAVMPPASMAGKGENASMASHEMARCGAKTKQLEREESQNSNSKKNTRNTVLKIVIDQSVGAAWSSALFIVTISALNGQDVKTIQQSLYKDFVPIIMAGLKLWPMVSVLNFTMISPEKRVLTVSLFGMIWGIYLSLRSEV
ncbi:integral membrane protein, Mpv17/PMP22 family [Histoplasma capsulatum var. duboisii H88]|uniref:Integral membrane protein, Mpv17/PMP22 family n=2 Tax=Ajellomyces capsulatus (strain H88) TaxID=544711 RepID=A0A8A1LA60_AJEC8|nr:integral membrane protein, Mpv17/PMP22 family [Histoplasma capsulatum var. duboisii H88]